MRHVVLGLIRTYQQTLSPDHGPLKRFYPYGYCRFRPTCSTYAYVAVERHGTLKGGWLALRRLGRCHPWSPGGHDEVPT